MNIINKINIHLKDDIDSLNKLILKSIKSDTELIEAVSNHLINAGGKRIRPLLTIICAKLFDYKGDLHINLAAAVEFIHTATLLHDDVVDESTVRRSIPTANVIWGSKASILVGDYLFSQAFCQMVNGNSIRALESLSKAAAKITEGEVMQLTKIHNINMTEDDYFKVISYKTAELFASSCEIGAIISNQNEETLSCLRDYGQNLGIIFQLADDYLDYFADANELGKNLGADFKEGKVTLPVIYTYNKSTDQEKLFWQRTMVDLNQNSEDFDIAKNLMVKYQVENFSSQKTTMLKNNMIENLNSLNIENLYKDFLIQLIDFVSDRLS